MFNTEVIDTAFAELIKQPGIHRQLYVTSNNVRQLRKRLQYGPRVSTDLKLKLLQKAGFTQDAHQYTQHDLVSLAKFVLHSSAATKELGAEYMVKKFLQVK
jgi:hypothetical protein